MSQDGGDGSAAPHSTVQLRRILGLPEVDGDGGPGRYVKIAAPMVRYSKLPFRLLALQYGCDATFTPMIIAQAFNRSAASRDSDFSTCPGDVPVVVQFAARDPDEFAAAAEKVAATGLRRVDLNCGCPQSWAMHDGLGAALSSDPDLVADLVAAVKRRVPDVHVSVKIRLCPDLDRTRRLVRRVEDAGVAFITVHGRTAAERTRVPVHLDRIRQIKGRGGPHLRVSRPPTCGSEFARVPIVANGDAFAALDADAIAAATGVDGVMSARGLLANPAMFGGHDQVPIGAAVQYVRLALLYGGPFFIHLHHVMYMLDPYLAPPDRRRLHALTSLAAVVDFFRARRWIPINWTLL